MTTSPTEQPDALPTVEQPDALPTVEQPDALPELGNDLFLAVAGHLGLADLPRALRVSRSWQTVLDSADFLWACMCQKLWETKAYVPKSLRVLAEGSAAVLEAEKEERRLLMRLKVRELVEKMRSLHVPARPAELIEKGDFADAIISAKFEAAQKAAAANGDEPCASMLLLRPSLLVRPGEALPKAALRCDPNPAWCIIPFGCHLACGLCHLGRAS